MRRKSWQTKIMKATKTIWQLQNKPWILKSIVFFAKDLNPTISKVNCLSRISLASFISNYLKEICEKQLKSFSLSVFGLRGCSDFYPCNYMSSWQLDISHLWFCIMKIYHLSSTSFSGKKGLFFKLQIVFSLFYLIKEYSVNREWKFCSIP